jgi:ERCC4-type nuclease
MSGIVVIADTREQEPYLFTPTRITTIRRALVAGDYSLAGLENCVAVERKTVEDLVKTVIRRRDRFGRELARLATFDAACVVVEGSLEDILAADYRCGAAPSSVLGAVLAIVVDRGIPVFFCGDRAAARTFTEGYLIRCHRKFSQSCIPTP